MAPPHPKPKRILPAATTIEADRVQAVLFDWDGTLLDSYHADSTAYQAMFKKLGIAWGIAELEKHYSPNWHRVYRAAGIPKERWAQADQLWRAAYASLRPALMPGTRRVLRQLAGNYVLGLVTSGNRARVRGQLRKFGFAQVFRAAVFAEDAQQRKPHPAPLKLALVRLQLRADECIYVGDSPEDIEMAHRAGVRAIAVLGPFPNHKRLRAAGASELLESLDELPATLRKMRSAAAKKRRNG